MLIFDSKLHAEFIVSTNLNDKTLSTRIRWGVKSTHCNQIYEIFKHCSWSIWVDELRLHPFVKSNYSIILLWNVQQLLTVERRLLTKLPCFLKGYFSFFFNLWPLFSLNCKFFFCILSPFYGDFFWFVIKIHVLNQQLNQQLKKHEKKILLRSHGFCLAFYRYCPKSTYGWGLWNL